MLCRDVCHYCTFARPPKRGERCYLTPDEVLAIAAPGPRGRLPRGALHARRQARAALPRGARGARAPRLPDHRGLPRALRRARAARDGSAAARQPRHPRRRRAARPARGLRLAGDHARDGERAPVAARRARTSARPTSCPTVRLDAIDRAGRLAIPYTSGILIGIGETRRERVEALLALRDLHRAPRAPAGDHRPELPRQGRHEDGRGARADARRPPLDDRRRAPAAAARRRGPGAAEPRARRVPAPARGRHRRLRRRLARDARPRQPRGARGPSARGSRRPRPRPAARSRPRLCIYPRFLRDAERWLAKGVRGAALAASDGRRPRARRGHLVRRHEPRAAARLAGRAPPAARAARSRRLRAGARAQRARRRSRRGRRRGAAVGARPRGRAARRGGRRAPRRALRRPRHLRRLPEHQLHERLLLPLRVLRVLEGPARRQPARPRLPARRRRGRAPLPSRPGTRGATEVCLQGGIHPGFTRPWYLELLRADQGGAAATPRARVLAARGLAGRRDRGLGAARLPRAAARRRASAALPGTAAEILDDEVRRVLCPDKLRPRSGSRSCARRTASACARRRRSCSGTSRRPINQARHLLAIRDLQRETGGFTEFVPLPFVHEEAPIALKGAARHGPTFREAVVLHAAARLILDPYMPNIQASWVKLGPDGARALLHAGVNDLGGTLMNESISRAAGASHGQECPPERMEEAIRAAGREPAAAHDAVRRRRRPSASPPRSAPRRSRRRRSAALRRRWVAAARPADPAGVASAGADEPPEVR